MVIGRSSRKPALRTCTIMAGHLAGPRFWNGRCLAARPEPSLGKLNHTASRRRPPVARVRAAVHGKRKRLIKMDVIALKGQWLSNPRKDILAGIVVALALIPEAIGFSIIARVDPRVGLLSAG